VFFFTKFVLYYSNILYIARDMASSKALDFLVSLKLKKIERYPFFYVSNWSIDFQVGV